MLFQFLYLNVNANFLKVISSLFKILLWVIYDESCHIAFLGRKACKV